MTASQNRMLKILLRLLTVLVLLLAAALTIKHFRTALEENGGTSSGNSSQTTSIQLTAPDAAFSALSYSNGSTTLSFSQDENGVWSWDGDEEFPLDTTCIDAIMSELAALEPAMSITDGDTLDAYGLDEHTLYLSAKNADGTRLHLDFGDKTPDGSGYYALMDDDPDTVYVLNTTIPSQLDTAVYDMMLLPELPELEEAAFSSVTVRGAVSTTMVAFLSQTENTAETGSAASSASSGASSSAAASAASPQEAEIVVSWRAEGANVTDSQRLQDLIADLSAMSLARCEDFKPSDQAVSSFGLAEPAAVVEITHGTDQFLSITIGNETLAGGAYYVRLADDTTIYSMNEDFLDVVLTVAAYGLEGNPDTAGEDTAAPAA